MPEHCLKAVFDGNDGCDFSASFVDFECEQYWQVGAPPAALVALVVRFGGVTFYTVVDPDDASVIRADAPTSLDALERCLSKLGRPLFRVGESISLCPVSIPKPWGQEIWYTGIESRGQALAGIAGASVPLAWLLAAFPRMLTGSDGRGLVLLKILDPLPTEVYGDLYLELHEEKREVYVVTHVSPSAWPNGTGAIRYGASPQQLAASGDIEAYKAAFLKAIRQYEHVRRQIDQQLDAIGGDRETALLSVPAALREEEVALREQMNAFTALKPLRVGDVVKVPLNFPHSLQHGVRTVEFQTPVYERKILSFAQKVLTQSHWDSEYAIEHMVFEEPVSDLEQIDAGSWGHEERIVSFPDFEVRRICLNSGASYVLKTDGYALAMGILGEVNVPGAALGPEQAVLLPPRGETTVVQGIARQQSVFLVAFPRHD